MLADSPQSSPVAKYLSSLQPTPSEMPSANPVASLLSGDIAERVRRLELFSRRIVEGATAGENRSPFKGFSTDFLQHRQYFHGDNLKYLDWRVYGKTDKLYVREFEDLTNAQMNLVVDISASMAFNGEGFSKHEFTVRCAGIIAYLMFLQRDDFGLFFFNNSVVEHLRPSSTRKHLIRVFERLVSSEAVGETDFKACLGFVEARAVRRGLVAIFSDFMADPDLIAHRLGRLRMRGHDVIVFQVFDPLEQELAYVDFTRFRDLETGAVTAIDPLLVKEEYHRQFVKHQHDMRAECLKHGIDHVLLPVSAEFDKVLGDYLRHRMALML